MTFRDPRFAIAASAILLFAAAFVINSHDQTLIGAMIGAFNLAIGYYLGSSSGTERARENTAKALEVAAAAQAQNP